jgi:radical SAM protein with 4Fe4S-binding SPASM domain
MKSEKELEHRLKQTTGVHNLKTTLRNIEINVIDSCNRSCDACPHSDDSYNFRYGRGDVTLYHRLAEQLREYTNSITLCGYGEPTMFKQLTDAIRILRTTPAQIELTTNGELLTVDKVRELFNAGLDFINISVYEEAYVEHTNELVSILDSSQYLVRDRYLNQIKIVDRKGVLDETGKAKSNPCYLPSYKMIVNYNGDVYLCCNDWTRKNIYGNVSETNIFTIWEERMTEKRMELLAGNRQGCCSHCDIDGTDYGEESANYFKSIKKLP